MSWNDLQAQLTATVEKATVTANAERMRLSDFTVNTDTAIVLGIGVHDDDHTKSNVFNPATKVRDGWSAIQFYNLAQIWVTMPGQENGTLVRWHYTNTPEDPINVLGFNQRQDDALMKKVKRFWPNNTFWTAQPQLTYYLPIAFMPTRTVKGKLSYNWEDATFAQLELNASRYNRLIESYNDYMKAAPEDNSHIYGRVAMLNVSTSRPSFEKFKWQIHPDSITTDESFNSFVEATRESLNDYYKGIYDRMPTADKVWEAIDEALAEQGSNRQAFIELYNLNAQAVVLDEGEAVSLWD